jgi:preprotein translocase subunit SecA
MFNLLLTGLRERVTSILSRVELRTAPPPEDLEPRAPQGHEVKEQVQPVVGSIAPLPSAIDAQRMLPRVRADQRDPGDPSTWGKVARNESCPCGSGKKYKHCHGTVEEVA